jgi:hypothetical protein
MWQVFTRILPTGLNEKQKRLEVVLRLVEMVDLAAVVADLFDYFPNNFWTFSI